MEKIKTDTENMLKKARIQSNKGTKLTILLSQRDLLQLRLNELNKTRYYSEAEVKLYYLNEHQRSSSDLSTYKMKNLRYSTDLQLLGKNIVDKLNEIETKLISDLISMTKTHLELRIELIDKLIKDINNEKSYTYTG